jgi:hypothetical protein
LARLKTALVEIGVFLVDEVIDFVKRLFQEMYQLEFMNRTEKYSFEDVEAFSDHLDEQYFHGGTHGIGITRPVFRTPDNFTDPANSIKKRKPPILFQVKEYEDAKWGKVYKVYASSTNASGSDIYFRIHYVAKVDGQWKIVGQDAASQGEFEHRYGENFDHLKNPLEIRKLQPPADLADLEEYNAE